VRSALLLTLLLGCGRFGFDAHGTDGAIGDGATGDGAPAISLALPAGGDITFVAIDLTGPWYIVTRTGRAYRSDDHMSWIACGEHFVTRLTVGPGGALFAGGNDVARSTDHCATWQPVPTGRFTTDVGTDGTSVFALVDNGLRKLSGTMWTTVTTPLDGAGFKTFARAPASKYLIGTTNGLLHSDDGINWAAVAGLSSSNIVDVASSPTRLYAIATASGTSNGEIECSDGTGVTWTQRIGTGGISVAVDPTNDSHAFAAIYDNLLETTDAFTSTTLQERRGADMGEEVVNMVRFQADGAVVAAGDRGVFYAAPGTIAWEGRHTGLTAWNVHDELRTGGEVYVATSGGVLHAYDGEPFTHSFTGMMDNTENHAMAVTSDGTIISVGRHIWASSDHGATWSPLLLLPGTDGYRGYSIALAPAGRAFVGTATSVLVADPPYAAWQRHAASMVVDDLRLVGTRLWLAGDQGVKFSDDDAMTFQGVLTGLDAHTLAQLPDGRIIVGGDEGFAIEGSFTLQTQVTQIRKLLVVGTVIVAATDSGIYASHDGGATWIQGATKAATALLVDPGDGSLVVGTGGDGVYRAAIP
jgi:hypothetical protein